MTLHLVALPQAAVLRPSEWSWASPYVQIVRGFASMMTGTHRVLIYAPGEDTDVPRTEFISCATHPVQTTNIPTWYNTRVASEIQKRQQPGDALCLVYGHAQESIAAQVKMTTVEIAVGYEGICRTEHTHRIFPSLAWQHYVYGVHRFGRGFPLDAVIPHFFDPDDFTTAVPLDHFVYLGRLTADKGVLMAACAAKAFKAPLLVSGTGDCRPAGPLYLNPVSLEQRRDLLSQARGLFCLTQYIGPFESTHVEAMLSGVPVITTDHGVFTETVINGFNGFRVHSIDEAVNAMALCDRLDRTAIRQWAVEHYSLAAVRSKYEAYFQRLESRHA